MFTEDELTLMKKCSDCCYGGMRFADSVKRQGWCSPKQKRAMVNIISAAEYRKNNKPHKSSLQTRRDAAFSDYSEGGYL